jgi:hypothetical protein
VGKYLGKTLGEGWPKGKRRVNTSRSWPPLPEIDSPPGWIFAQIPPKRSIQAEMNVFTANGYDVTFASAAGSWALIDSLVGRETVDGM